MSSTNTLSGKRDNVVPRTAFVVLCGIAALLLVAVLLLWFKDTGGPRHVSGLDAALDDEGTAFAALVDSKGQFSLFEPISGDPIRPCGSNSNTNDTSLPKECDFTNIKELRTFSSLAIVGFARSDCQLVTSGDNTYSVHYQGPNRGRSPCHHPH